MIKAAEMRTSSTVMFTDPVKRKVTRFPLAAI